MDLIALKNNKSKQIKKIEIKNRNLIDKREIHETRSKEVSSLLSSHPN